MSRVKTAKAPNRIATPARKQKNEVAPSNTFVVSLTSPDQTEADRIGLLACDAAMNAACVMHAYKGDVLRGVEPNSLLIATDFHAHRVKNGDLSGIEAMLVGQALALQSMFSNLARRAQAQTLQRNFEAFLGLAFKAQAQSRATMQALVDLKYPRQPATFVKQANIAQGGPQQVNNGSPSGQVPHAEKAPAVQNKLLEVKHGKPGSRLDTTASATAKRGDPALATVGEVHRAAKRAGQSDGRTQRRQGR